MLAAHRSRLRVTCTVERQRNAQAALAALVPICSGAGERKISKVETENVYSESIIEFEID